MADKLVLASMHSVIIAFEKGEATLKIMIDKLRGLYRVKPDSDEEWSEIFFEHWGMMEEVYAVAAAKNLSELDQEGVSHVYKAERALRLEIERRIGS